MAVLYSNNAETTITGSISASATTLVVATGSGAEFPNPGADDHFYITLVGDDGTGGDVLEVVRCTTRSGDTLTIERGLDGTTASAFNAGDKIELRVTKILMDDIQEDAADEAMAMAIAIG